jgi:hypothetical protein
MLRSRRGFRDKQYISHSRSAHSVERFRFIRYLTYVVATQPSTDHACEEPNPVEVSVKKLVLFAGAAVLMTACSESSTAPSGPQRAAPTGRASSDLECRSGYIVAYDENGNPYCTAVQYGSTTTTRPRP